VGTGCFVGYDTPIARGSKSQARSIHSQHTGRLKDPTLTLRGWNDLRIRCEGDRITVWINHERINEISSVPQRSGTICLRSQNTHVQFHDVRIRRLEN